MIELKNISKIYHSKSGDTQALKNIELTFGETGLVMIVGESGSGKSTLMNIIGGLDNYTDGELILNGASTKEYSNADYDMFRNNHVGFVFQEFNLLEEYDVWKNISIALELQRVKEKEEIISSALESVGLAGYGKRKIFELSGGQKQRVAIARALVKSPKIIFADEPTGNLDSENSTEIFELFKTLSSDHLVMIVTHDIDNAQKYADRIIELSDGIVVKDSCKLDSNKLDSIDLKSDKPDSDKGNIHNELALDNKPLSSKKKEKGKSPNLRFRDILILTTTSMWKRKYRLIATLVLFAFSFTLFGVGISAFGYNADKALVKAYSESEYNEIVWQKNYNPSEPRGGDFYSWDEEKEIKAQFPNEKLIPIYPNKNLGVGVTPSILNYELPSGSDKYAVIDKSYIDKDVDVDNGNMKLLYGHLPIEKYDFALTKVMADDLIANEEFQADTGILTLDTLVGYKFRMHGYIDENKNNIKFCIVGIIDTFAEHDFEIYKEQVNTKFARFDDAYREPLLSARQITIMHTSAHYSVIASQDFIDDVFLAENKGVLQYDWIMSKDKVRDGKVMDYFNAKNDVDNVGCLSKELLAAKYDNETFMKLGTILGVVFGLCAVIMMLSFIMSSIKDSKKKIGVLRSLGASNTSVFWIYYLESLIIGMAGFLLAMVAMAILLPVLNANDSNLMINIPFLIVTPWTLLALFATLLSTVTLGCIAPIARLIKKKPIEIITNR